MKCEETLSKIDGYINNNLSYREMEDFLEHIKNCPDCYDELETYYTITVGMKYLEEEKLESYNIPKMLKEDLKQKEHFLKRRHLLTSTMILFGMLVGIGIAFSLLLYLGHIELPNLF